jgi:hypothetical protein
VKNNSNYKRWRLIADPRIQGTLCLRVAVYWVLCQLTVFGTMFGFAFLEGSGSEGFQHLVIPAMIASGVVLPAVIVDMISFSNRFAGPLRNFRRRFDDFATTGEFEEIRFRKGDFFPDLQENFNRIASQQIRVESATTQSVESDERMPQPVG